MQELRWIQLVSTKGRLETVARGVKVGTPYIHDQKECSQTRKVSMESKLLTRNMACSHCLKNKPNNTTTTSHKIPVSTRLGSSGNKVLHKTARDIGGKAESDGLWYIQIQLLLQSHRIVSGQKYPQINSSKLQKFVKGACATCDKYRPMC